jgi:hypothetical protein
MPSPSRSAALASCARRPVSSSNISILFSITYTHTHTHTHTHFWRTPKESCKGLGSVTLKINTEHTHWTTWYRDRRKAPNMVHWRRYKTLIFKLPQEVSSSAHTRTHTHTHTHTHAHTHTYIHTYTHTHTHTHTQTHAYIHKYIHIHVCMYVYT